MATQGIISIVKDEKVIFKCIAGCNGMNAAKTSEALKAVKNPTLNQIYDICIDNDFGCIGCLIVQSATKYKGTDCELPDRYLNKFQEPRFNPRWENGTADYIEVIAINTIYRIDGAPIYFEPTIGKGVAYFNRRTDAEQYLRKQGFYLEKRKWTSVCNHEPGTENKWWYNKPLSDDGQAYDDTRYAIITPVEVH